MRLCFKKYFCHHLPRLMREVSREKYLQNAVSFNILVHDMINLLCYECRTSKQKYFYVYKVISLYNDCEQLMMSLVRNIDILLVS